MLSSPSSSLRNGAEGRAHADGDVPSLCPPPRPFGRAPHSTGADHPQQHARATCLHVSRSTRNCAQQLLFFLPAVPQLSVPRCTWGPWDGPKQGEPFPPCLPLLQPWWEGPLLGSGRGRTMGPAMGAFAGALWGGREGQTPSLPPLRPICAPCQQWSNFRGFHKITCHQKAPVNQCPLAWIHPGFGDGATVHHRSGKPAPAEPGSPCSVPMSSAPTSPSRQKRGFAKTGISA